MRKVSDTVKPIDLTGKFIGMYVEGQPYLVRLEGVLFLPVFSTVEALQASAARTGVVVLPKVITDGVDFLDSVRGVRIMVDPWHTPKGNTRFTEVIAANQN